MKYLLLLLSLTILSCERSEKFLEAAPQRFVKDYKMGVNTSLMGAQQVDILWVIDNSGSMSDEQIAVRDNSAQFIQNFTSTTNLQWRMGLISTSLGWAPYMGFESVVDWTSVDGVGQFNAGVSRLGTGGDPSEKFYDPVLSTLDLYPSFLRPGAFLVLIVVTDDREQSSIGTEQFIAEISRRMGGPDRFATFSVVDPLTAGQAYADIVRLTKGKTYDVHSPDYGVLLAQLGQDLVQRVMSLNPVIVLDQLPKPETIQVIYKGRVLMGGTQWTYDPIYNLIRIQDPSLLDANVLKVQVSFELQGQRK